MQRSAATEPSGAPGHRRVAAAAASLAALALLAGCASPAGATTVSLSAVVTERDRASAQSHQEGMARVAEFLRDRWGPVALPDESIVRWVPDGEWAGEIARCLSDAGFPGATAADGGQRVDFSGVRTEGTRDLYLVDVAIYVCQTQYPVLSWYEDQVAGIEAPWAYSYVVGVQVPCLLAAGYRVPAVPERAAFLESWRGDDGWNAFALIAADPIQEQRARAQCAPPEVLLESGT